MKKLFCYLDSGTYDLEFCYNDSSEVQFVLL